MSISLEKKSKIISRILLKKGVEKAPIMRVGIALDISRSMGRMIRDGILQKSFNQMMGVSHKFDDNGELDTFKFDTRCEYVGTASPNDYENYIEKNRIVARGGTSYAPIVAAVEQFFFKPKKSSFLGFGKKVDADTSPVLMLILTDGEPGETYPTVLKAFKEIQHKNIYFHLVGIGGGKSSFPTISKLADDLPNVGEVYLQRLDMSDEKIYEQLICDELVEWLVETTS